ncbi:MAG: RagB/SusD family nutrient uptake outer membrane protein [Saprospiraceae bacterium]|nr:RagB/SusD family nutrient uptake outer membrane protein [Saprospiraceae bacterium]
MRLRTIKYLSGFCCLAFVVLAIAGCDKALDKEPLGRLDAGSFFKSAEDAIQVLNACYEPLLINNNNNNFYWVFGTVASDEAITGGDGSRPGILEVDLFRHTPRTQELNDFWKLNYAGIVQCNLVIEKTPLIQADEDLKNRIRGQALFLRAWYHFMLTQIFGDVPLIDRIIPPEEIRLPRTPVGLVYDQIILDCEEASGLLPVSNPANEVFRVTRGAALGLMAKTYLYRKNWEQVIMSVAKIKALNIYGLMPDYQDNFRENTQNNMESVWEIQHQNLELGVGNSINQWWATKKLPDGYGYAEVTQEFVDAFETGDPRLSYTVASRNDDYFGTRYIGSFSSTGHSPRKYLQPVEEVSQKADGDINYTAIRYAEVLLWEAEALAELGRISEAALPLEEVRARSRAQSDDPENTLPAISTSDQGSLIQAIRHERQVELGFEMHRFFDLVRWGVADQLLDGFVKGKHEVFPIPQTEIDLNPLLTQNPEY